MSQQKTEKNAHRHTKHTSRCLKMEKMTAKIHVLAFVPFAHRPWQCISHIHTFSERTNRMLREVTQQPKWIAYILFFSNFYSDFVVTTAQHGMSENQCNFFIRREDVNTEQWRERQAASAIFLFFHTHGSWHVIHIMVYRRNQLGFQSARNWTKWEPQKKGKTHTFTALHPKNFGE